MRLTKIIQTIWLISGLVKAKKYNWKDSNMALFGSDLERQVKSKYSEIPLLRPPKIKTSIKNLISKV